MTTDRDFERTAADWLNAGSDATPPRVIDAVLLAVRTTPQERDVRIAWRAPFMRRAASAAVIAIVAIAVAFYAFGRGPGVGPAPASSPSTEESVAPSPAATAKAKPIDVTGWTTYQSDRYGFSIGHPPDWDEISADHDWTIEKDGSNWQSTGQEAFVSHAGDGIRVSAWRVSQDPGATTDPDLFAWVEDYCLRTNNAPCDGIPQRAVHLCVERRDCHPGLLVRFAGDVQAFFTGGAYTNEVVVVAVWWAESDPAVLPYGGATRLLEGFLETMGVYPAP